MKKLLPIFAISILFLSACATTSVNLGDDREYYSESKEACVTIEFTCAEGTEFFSDTTGCGCEDVNEEDSNIIIVVDEEPVEEEPADEESAEEEPADEEPDEEEPAEEEPADEEEDEEEVVEEDVVEEEEEIVEEEVAEEDVVEEEESAE